MSELELLKEEYYHEMSYGDKMSENMYWTIRTVVIALVLGTFLTYVVAGGYDHSNRTNLQKTQVRIHCIDHGKQLISGNCIKVPA